MYPTTKYLWVEKGINSTVVQRQCVVHRALRVCKQLIFRKPCVLCKFCATFWGPKADKIQLHALLLDLFNNLLTELACQLPAKAFVVCTRLRQACFTKTSRVQAAVIAAFCHHIEIVAGIKLANLGQKEHSLTEGSSHAASSYQYHDVVVVPKIAHIDLFLFRYKPSLLTCKTRLADRSPRCSQDKQLT